MDFETYQKLKNQIIQEYNERLSALELLWRTSSLNAAKEGSMKVVLNGWTAPNSTPSLNLESMPFTQTTQGSWPQTGLIPNAISAREIGGSLMGAVRFYVKNTGAEFTINDLEKYFQNIRPDAKRLALQTALSRLLKSKEIEIVVKGGGRKANVYRRALREGN